MQTHALLKQQTQNVAIVEECVPAHMMVLAIQKCMEKGIECREDVMRFLNVAAVAPLARLDTATISVLAKRTDDLATNLLRELNADEPEHALYVSAMFVMLLVDEGRIKDPRSQAVLTSLLLLNDLRDDTKDEAGNEPIWPFQETRLREDAKKLLMRANLMGHFFKDTPIVH